MKTVKNYFVQGQQGQNPVIIEAHSGYEAMGYYLMELDNDFLCVEDIMLQALSEQELVKYKAAGVLVYTAL